MFSFKKKIACLLSLVILFSGISSVSAQTAIIDAKKLVPRVSVSLSPSSGSFTEGSTFEVPILLNTRGSNINSVDLKINFDQRQLSIVQPSNGKSIIGVWVEPPRYDNTRGTASYVGVITNGITTGSGLIGAITFKALRSGSAVISIGSDSSVLLNDGLGTMAIVELGRAAYTILPKAPDGVAIFSETHPSPDDWYNNNTGAVSWEKAAGVSGFSLEFDNKPATVPDNTVDTEQTTKTFEGLADGLWYLHVKANKGGVWGTPGHFLVRIDTTPPAEFTPEANYLLAAALLVDRTFVSFFTTDNLSGVDHYEVGVIDKNQPATQSPVFVQTESPYQLAVASGSNSYAIVRAIDKAGNVRDASIRIQPPRAISKFVKDYLVYILLFIILLGLIILTTHYLVGHHIIRSIRRLRDLMKKEEGGSSTEGVKVDDQNKGGPALPG